MILFRYQYKNIIFLFSPFNKIVESNHNIEEIASYVQLQDNNDFNNSLTEALGEARSLYMLLSAKINDEKCVQIAFTANGRFAFRFYEWWNYKFSSWYIFSNNT